MDLFAGLAGLYLFVVLFLFVLAICWIILPFAILGTKPLLRQLLAETKRTNELLTRIGPPAASSAARPPDVVRTHRSPGS